MAYMNQERKQAKAPAIAAICKKYGIKARLAVDNHSTLVLNISSGPIDFIKNTNETREGRTSASWTPRVGYIQVNPFYIDEYFTGDARSFLKEVLAVMNAGNHDNSDSQSDYFDIGWYVNVNVGRWNKPYQLV